MLHSERTDSNFSAAVSCGRRECARISRSDTAMTRIRPNAPRGHWEQQGREGGRERPNAVQRHRSKLPCGNSAAVPLSSRCLKGALAPAECKPWWFRSSFVCSKLEKHPRKGHHWTISTCNFLRAQLNPPSSVPLFPALHGGSRVLITKDDLSRLGASSSTSPVMPAGRGST